MITILNCQQVSLIKLLKLILDPLALNLKQLELRSQPDLLLGMFLFDFSQSLQILLSDADLGPQVNVANFNFLVLVVLVIEMVSEYGDQFSIGQIIKIVDKIVSDLDVKETSLFHHFKLNIVDPNCIYWLMLLQWALILAVTSVSVTMLMIIGSYLAILPEAEEFYNVSRTKVLLLANIFNIGYILITPFIFNFFHKHYIKGILIATVATAVGAVGRYVAEENYNLSLAMTSIVAVSHIPIITAPYGLLKLFPDWQKGYAASIPLFLPVLGINFCILYGMAYIADDGSHSKTINEVHAEISGLNRIIAIVGLLASTATVILTLMLKNKIEQEPHTQKHQQLQEAGSTTEGQGSAYNPKEVEVEPSLPQIQRNQPQSEGAFQGIVNMVKKLFSQKRTAVLVISWGIIVGINWTYGALFGVIFSGQNLTGKEIALIGLAANLSSAIFSNLGTFIKNRFNLENIVVIEYLNIFGIAAAIVIQFSRFMEVMQGLYFMIFLIIVLRAGLSSFVSLAFVEMEKQGMSSLIVSAFFFWVANLSNLAGMEIVDLVVVDLSLFLLTLTAGICVYVVNRHEYMECSRSI